MALKEEPEARIVVPLVQEAQRDLKETEKGGKPTEGKLLC